MDIMKEYHRGVGLGAETTSLLLKRKWGKAGRGQEKRMAYFPPEGQVRGRHLVQ